MLAGTAAMFIVQGNCRGGPEREQTGPGKDLVVVKVGATEIVSQQVAALVDQKEQQAAPTDSSTSPAQTAQDTGQALDSLIEQAALIQLAQKNGVKMSDDDIRREAGASIDQQVMMAKLQLMMQNKLKPNATDADLEKVLGKPIKQIKDEQMASIDEKIKDPASRSMLVGALARPAIERSLASRATPNEEDVKRQFASLTVKRIYIPSPATGTDDSSAKAKQALDEVKKGTSFEAAMDRYSKDPAPKGKRVSDSASLLTGSSLASDPSLKKLLTMKPGDTTDVLSVPGGVAIYKIVSSKTNLPPDYDKKKGDYAKSYAQFVARSQIDADLADIKKNLKPEWKSKGYKAAYDFTSVFKMTGASQSAQKKALEDVEKEAADAVANGDDQGQKIATCVRYAVSTMLQMGAKPEEKKKMLADRIETLVQVLKYTDGPDFRLELADLQAEAKHLPEAATNLVEAARTNSEVDANGQRRFNEINAHVEKFKKAGILKPQDEKAIMTEQDRWKKDRADEEKAQAERKKADEEDRKRAEEEKQRAIKVKSEPAQAPPSATAKPGK